MENHRVAASGAWSKAFRKPCYAFSKIKKAAASFFRKLKVSRNHLLPVPPENGLPVVATTGSLNLSTTLPGSAPNMLVQPVDHIVVNIDPVRDSPFTKNFQKQELGKLLFTISIPIMTGLILFHGENLSIVVCFTLVGLSTGCTFILNGLLLRETYPRISNFAEQSGISISLLSFNVQVGSYFPPHLRFIPVLCYGVSVLPFAIAAIQNEEDNSNATIHNDDGIGDTQSSEVAENTDVLVITRSLAQV